MEGDGYGIHGATSPLYYRPKEFEHPVSSTLPLAVRTDELAEIPAAFAMPVLTSSLHPEFVTAYLGIGTGIAHRRLQERDQHSIRCVAAGDRHCPGQYIRSGQFGGYGGSRVMQIREAYT